MMRNEKNRSSAATLERERVERTTGRASIPAVVKRQ